MKRLHLEKLKDTHPHQCKEKTQAGNFRDETGKNDIWIKNWEQCQKQYKPKNRHSHTVPWQIVRLVIPRFLGSKADQKQQWLQIHGRRAGQEMKTLRRVTLKSSCKHPQLDGEHFLPSSKHHVPFGNDSTARSPPAVGTGLDQWWEGDRAQMPRKD